MAKKQHAKPPTSSRVHPQLPKPRDQAQELSPEQQKALDEAQAAKLLEAYGKMPAEEQNRLADAVRYAGTHLPRTKEIEPVSDVIANQTINTVCQPTLAEQPRRLMTDSIEDILYKSMGKSIVAETKETASPMHLDSPVTPKAGSIAACKIIAGVKKGDKQVSR